LFSWFEEFYADGSPLLINTNFSLWTTQSGAKINITDGSSPERIVTVLGPHQTIIKVRKIAVWAPPDHHQSKKNRGNLKVMKKTENIKPI
jgi:hypothetical protein